MEHRCGRRIEVEVPVTLGLSSGERVPGRIVNISLSGALLRTQARLPSLGRLTVQLETDESCEGPPRTVLAHIVRRMAGGAGLEWSEFSPAAICALLAEAGNTSSERCDARTLDVRAISAM